jgi:hypothetical protein
MKYCGGFLAALMIVSASTALAVDPAIRCQAAKLKAASKYTNCRLMAAAAAARHFDLPDYTRCDANFSSDWARAEKHALGQGSPCWSMNDGATVQADITLHTDALAGALAGDK